jgi:hypothetical protein
MALFPARARVKARPASVFCWIARQKSENGPAFTRNDEGKSRKGAGQSEAGLGFLLDCATKKRERSGFYPQ